MRGEGRGNGAGEEGLATHSKLDLEANDLFGRPGLLLEHRLRAHPDRAVWKEQAALLGEREVGRPGQSFWRDHQLVAHLLRAQAQRPCQAMVTQGPRLVSMGVTSGPGLVGSSRVWHR